MNHTQLTVSRLLLIMKFRLYWPRVIDNDGTPGHCLLLSTQSSVFSSEKKIHEYPWKWNKWKQMVETLSKRRNEQHLRTNIFYSQQINVTWKIIIFKHKIILFFRRIFQSWKINCEVYSLKLLGSMSLFIHMVNQTSIIKSKSNTKLVIPIKMLIYTLGGFLWYKLSKSIFRNFDKELGMIHCALPFIYNALLNSSFLIYVVTENM